MFNGLVQWKIYRKTPLIVMENQWFPVIFPSINPLILITNKHRIEVADQPFYRDTFGYHEWDTPSQFAPPKMFFLEMLTTNNHEILHHQPGLNS